LVAKYVKKTTNEVNDWVDCYEVNKKSAHFIPLKITGATRTLPDGE
jgi:hypothetical protein